MSLVFKLVVVAQIVGIVTSTIVTVISVRRRHRRGALPLGVMAGGAVCWSLAELLTGYMPTFRTMAYMSNLSYVGIALSTTAFLVFTLEYTGREQWLTRRNLSLLSIEPVLLQLAVWTNPLHGQFYTYRAMPEAREIFHNLEFAFGPLFWVHAVYSYTLIATSIGLLLLMVYRRETVYRAQSAAIAITTVVPLAANLLNLTGIISVSLSLTPPAFAVSGAALALAILRVDLTDVAPIAHSTILANVRDGVVVLNEHDKILEINPMGKRILDLTDRSPVGTPASEALSDYPEVWSHFEDVEEGSEEIEVDTEDGPRTFQVQVSPVQDNRGRHVGRLFVFHDITRQKRRELRLQRQNEQLDQFASLVSHDLRNPLNVSDGYVQIARAADDPAAVEEHLEKIDQANDRMQQLIDDVLTLTRQDETVEETVEVELESIAREAWSNVDTREGDLVVETNLQFRADEDRLLRVFENLFRNALDHGPDDVTLCVGTIQGPDDTTAESASASGFYVADDGPGIPENERESIFDDGFTTADDGTGLGLSIVESIVDAHGWEIRVTESQDGGARFEIVGIESAILDVTVRDLPG